MILHIVKHSPFQHNQLHTCLDTMASDDGLLLIQDAVVACSNNPEWFSRLTGCQKLYVLESDCEARGINAEVGQRIDYPAMVELTLQFDKTMSW